MAESMLAILCHILRGEPVIRERLSKEKEGSRGEEDTGQEEGGSRREPQVNQQQLQQVGSWLPHSRAQTLLPIENSQTHKYILSVHATKWVVSFLCLHATKCLVLLARR